MSISLSSMIFKPFSNPHSSLPPPNIWIRKQGLVIKCEVNDRSSPDEITRNNGSPKLEIGSPVIITEAPKMIKTAASVPCLRVNSDLVKPGDVGRVVSRKPMDVWAVRLSIGTYLIDRKYFKPLELDE